MKDMNRTTLKIILAVLVMDLWTGRPASASAGLMVWPSKIEISANAGGSKSGVINVQNQGLNKARLKVNTMNCRMDEDGSIVYTNKNVPFGCKQWLRVEPQEFEIKPGVSIQLLYTIDIPGNAQGTFLAAILLDGSSRNADDSRDLPGTLIVGTIAGTGQKAADLTELKFEKGAGGGNASAVLSVTNTGSLICVPTGSLEVTDVNRGGKVSFAINREKEPVLPSFLRRYRIPLEGLYNGQYKVLAVVDYKGGEILQGEATVTITAGELVSHQGRVLSGRNKPGGQQTATAQEPGGRAAGPSNPAPGPALSAGEIEQLNREAVKLYSEGDYEKAMAQWQKILRSSPGHTAAKKGADRARQKIEALKKARG